MICQGIKIDDEIYSKNNIQKMTTEELKMLVGFCEKITDCRKVANWSNNQEIKDYVDNLEGRINELSNKY